MENEGKKNEGLVKIWAVKVNNWGWRGPRTIYCDTKREAQLVYDNYEYADPIVYLGRFTEAHAADMMGDSNYAY